MSIIHILFFTFLFVIFNKIKFYQGWGTDSIVRSKGTKPLYGYGWNETFCGYNNLERNSCYKGKTCGYLGFYKGYACSPSEGGVFCDDTNDFCPKGFNCTMYNSTLCVRNLNEPDAKGIIVWKDWYRASIFKCLKEKLNIKFVIVHASYTDGFINENAELNIKKAVEAGIEYIDVYVSVCVNTPIEKVVSVLNYLNTNNAKFGNVYLFIAIENSCFNRGWYKNETANLELINEMANTLLINNQTFGIYTSKYDWHEITGNTKKFRNVPLLYKHIDNRNNLDDYYEFGGWEKPTMKEYSFEEACEINVAHVWKH